MFSTVSIRGYWARESEIASGTPVGFKTRGCKNFLIKYKIKAYVVNPYEPGGACAPCSPSNGGPGIAHVKLEFLLRQKMYFIPILGRFV